MKAASAIAMIGVAVPGGVFPMVAARAADSQRIFALDNSCAGRFFPGLGFIHFLSGGISEVE